MIFFGTHERGWANFRIGPAYPTPYPGVQFPLNAVDQYLAQLVPNSETTLEGGSANTVNALAALLDKIGPAVVVVHSQSGIYGLDVVRKRPGLVKALVSIEGGCETFKPDDASGPFAKVPMMTLWGDNSVGAKDTVNGDTRRNACVSAINAIKAAGGRATYTLLPDMGIKGNSHMLMLDRNNLQIADYLLQWIAANTQ